MDINELNKAYADQYFKDHNLEKRYTAPRELSDEEIMQLQAKYGIDSCLTKDSVKEFARAILKKASEK
jgi:hypothetical protein